MSQERPERDGVEVALEAKVAAWQAVLDAYRAAKAIDGSLGEASLVSGLQTASPKGAPLGSFDLPVGALRSKSVPDAIKLYLSAGRRKQTNKEIAAGLRQGGLETTAGNFEANIAAALFRLKKAGVVLRFKDGWDLAEHYADHIRNKLDNGIKPKKKRGKGKKAGRSTSRHAEAKAEKARGPIQPGLEQRINTYLQTRGNEFTTVQELVSQLKVSAPVLNLTLGKMKKAEKIEKNQNGLVRLIKQAA